MATSKSDIALRLAKPDNIEQLRLIYAASVKALAQGHYSSGRIAV
jgi:hypothetical protein